MGMFDVFRPKPAIECPRCDQALRGWQGKHPRSSLTVWEQGQREPLGDWAEDDPGQDAVYPGGISAKRRAHVCLPDWFSIHCGECPEHGRDSRIERCDCRCEDGVWVETQIVPRPIPSILIDAEEDGQWLQCSECCDAWLREGGKTLYFCPGCEALTQLGADPSRWWPVEPEPARASKMTEA